MELVDWRSSYQRRAGIEQAVRLLANGELVVFPTETGYAVAGSIEHPDTIARLQKLPAGAEPLTLGLPGFGHALDWVPEMSALGRRLARRCWPGPVRLVFDGGSNSVATRLPEPIRAALCPDSNVSLYVPGHEALAETLYFLPTPVALLPVRASSPDQLDPAVAGAVSLLIDDGPSVTAATMTAVRITGETWTMLTEGPITAAEIARKTTCVVLFVCTGNTCRSPMAEALAAKLLADRLNCKPDELPGRGFLLLSAGLAAMPGDPAAREAVEVMEELGADLKNHASRPLTSDLVLQADHVIAMTRGHQAALASRFGAHAVPPRLLDPSGEDIADPVGASREVYRECAQQIRQHIERFLPELCLARQPGM